MRAVKAGAFIALMVAVVMFAIALSGGTMDAAAQNTACYINQGGALWNAGEGCEWETLSGSVVDVQGDAYLTSATQGVGAGDTIVPVRAYMVLTSSAAVSLDTTTSITTSAGA
jgi:hypothetical protein